MVVRITSMVLRLSALITLILGILFWIGVIPYIPNSTPVNIHMLFGILVMLSLWVLGVVILRAKGGSIGLGIGAIIVGLLLPILGIEQTHLLTGANDPHWVIQVLHLLLGLLAIGLGEMITARYRRAHKQA